MIHEFEKKLYSILENNQGWEETKTLHSKAYELQLKTHREMCNQKHSLVTKTSKNTLVIKLKKWERVQNKPKQAKGGKMKENSKAIKYQSNIC